ncbi:SGNH/GDSL hydrolase family protein [Microbacterium trichothecenolyticum]|nr:SGNH/GDSL hydrolase family protein [Microbacterium trichothecenolyticum]
MRRGVAWGIAGGIVLVALAVGVLVAMTAGVERAPSSPATAPISASPSPTPSPTPTATPTPTARPGTALVQRDGAGVVRMLVAGDSLAAGFFASEKALGFTTLVADAVGPVEMTTAAYAHQTLTTVAAITDVPDDLGLAVIELGTNDVGLPTPLVDFEQNYAGLLDRVRVSSPTAALVCVGTWTSDGGAYDEVIARACGERGGIYVGLADAFADPANHGPAGRETFAGEGDDFHPNDAGHRAIAERILLALSY